MIQSKSKKGLGSLPPPESLLEPRGESQQRTNKRGLSRNKPKRASAETSTPRGRKTFPRDKFGRNSARPPLEPPITNSQTQSRDGTAVLANNVGPVGDQDSDTSIQDVEGEYNVDGGTVTQASEDEYVANGDTISHAENEDPLVEARLVQEEQQPIILVARAEETQPREKSCLESLVSTTGGRFFLFGIAALLSGIIVSAIVCGSGLCLDTEAGDQSTDQPTSTSVPDPPWDTAAPRPLIPCSVYEQINTSQHEDCTLETTRTCLMVYLWHDIEIEYYLDKKYEELTTAEFIRSSNIRTWINYDSPSFQGAPKTDSLDNTSFFSFDDGYGYATYDMDLGGMNKILKSEPNSTQQSIQMFLEHSMSDCLSHNYTSLMVVFAGIGSGFAGFAGFGGSTKEDMATNQYIAAAVKASLQGHKLPSSKLDVLGFDASLMQAVGVADDYWDLAHFILASEAIVPGSGWSYSGLAPPSSAVELAYQIQREFAGRSKDSTKNFTALAPLSILDTSMYPAFIAAFDNLFKVIIAALRDGDPTLYASLARSHASAVAFDGLVDATGTQNPSSIDVGSFLSMFGYLCDPQGDIQTALADAMSLYKKAFPPQQQPTTQVGTGMHITWPSTQDYHPRESLWDQILFASGNYATKGIPHFQEFLQWSFRESSRALSLGERSQESTCRVDGSPHLFDLIRSSPDSLIISDGTNFRKGHFFNISATIALDTSQVDVKYGLDLSTAIKPLLVANGYEPQDDEYLYFFGGSVAGSYFGSGFSAAWDLDFFVVNYTGTAVAASNAPFFPFVTDYGNGFRKIPVMYFSPKDRDSILNLRFSDYIFFNVDSWLKLGAQYGFFYFSVDTYSSPTNFSLFVLTSNGGAIVEKPPSMGGLVVPLVHVDAYLQGRRLHVLPGGINRTIIEWSENLDYNVQTADPFTLFSVVPSADAIVYAMYAHSHKSEDTDALYGDFKRERGARPWLQDGVDGSQHTSASASFPTYLRTLAGLVLALSSCC